MWWHVLVATFLLTYHARAQQTSSETTDAPRVPWNRYDDANVDYKDRNREVDYRDRSREVDYRDRNREVDYRDRSKDTDYRDRERDPNVYTSGGVNNYRPTNLPNENVVIKEA